jgi:hypothetical protein
MRTSDPGCLKSMVVIWTCNLSKAPVLEECSRPADLDEVQDRLFVLARYPAARLEI